MKIYITLDYELFFGDKPGSAESCITAPTQALLEVLDPHGIKATFYVDAGYLMALERQLDELPKLQKQYDLVSGQIQKLATDGHSIQLHVHPHWEDTFFKDGDWQMDTTRYRLADFTDDEVMEIVTRYNEILSRISGKPCSSYRAGGWSAQPFEAIGKALAANDIFLDSTAFPKGYYKSADQFYDFSKIPEFTSEYQFSEDPGVIDPAGKFKEIPIGAHRVSPFFFWRFVLVKLFGGDKHKGLGNGHAIKKEGNDIFRLLTRFSNSVVSIDGFKASYLQKALNRYKKNAKPDANFVIIGHPKALSLYSLEKLEQFIARNTDLEYHLL